MTGIKPICLIICPVDEAEAFRDQNQLPRVSLIPRVFGLGNSWYQEVENKCYFFVKAKREEAAKMVEALPGSTFV